MGAYEGEAISVLAKGLENSSFNYSPRAARRQRRVHFAERDHGLATRAHFTRELPVQSVAHRWSDADQQLGRAEEACWSRMEPPPGDLQRPHHRQCRYLTGGIAVGLSEVPIRTSSARRTAVGDQHVRQHAHNSVR